MIHGCSCGYMTTNKNSFDKHEKIAHDRRYRTKVRQMRKMQKKDKKKPL